MKKSIIYFLISIATLIPSLSFAQQQNAFHRHNAEQNDNKDGAFRRQKFDPERYQRELEAFITRHANLSEQEAQRFFPLYREMQQKMRAIFMRNKKFNKAAISDNKLALEAIQHHDTQEIEIKKLQQQYHNRFLKVLPATKVLKCIYAEDIYNKNLMRNIGKH